jgi:hypothetical protein
VFDLQIPADVALEFPGAAAAEPGLRVRLKEGLPSLFVSEQVRRLPAGAVVNGPSVQFSSGALLAFGRCSCSTWWSAAPSVFCG